MWPGCKDALQSWAIATWWGDSVTPSPMGMYWKDGLYEVVWVEVSCMGVNREGFGYG